MADLFSQAYIEHLVSGPRIAYDDNVALLNFAEKLNIAMKILGSDVDCEASVATSLRRIVSRLANDLREIEIVRRGRTVRLQDIANFVKRQASLRNDPVFGMRISRHERKETKDPPKPSKSEDFSLKSATLPPLTLIAHPRKWGQLPV